MSDGTSVTLVFYQIGERWWKEPALNLLAAAAQFSSFTHVEIAIGECAGHQGMMSNVARIFNDERGVELTQRTGRNPGALFPHIHNDTVPKLTWCAQHIPTCRLDAHALPSIACSRTHATKWASRFPTLGWHAPSYSLDKPMAARSSAPNSSRPFYAKADS